MEAEKEEEVTFVKASKPTLRDLFYLEWGLELCKKQYDLAIDLLKQQIAICIGLFAASFIFEKLFKDAAKLQAIILILWFIALLLAFIGLMPFERKGISLDSPTDIETYTKDTIRFKKRLHFGSSVFLITGLILIIIRLFNI
jgi:hypothetical protein